MSGARTQGERLLITVLVKDFDSAKTRLAGVLSPAQRIQVARENAARAIRAALAVAPTIAVCGSDAAAAVAAAEGAEVIAEERPRGQNHASRIGVDAAGLRGATAVLLLSSDLPLVDAAALREMVARAAAARGPVTVAAAAIGRAGTNALYLRPPSGFALHFGNASLPSFAAEAQRRGRAFIVHEDARLGLDLDEPDDLAELRRRLGAA